MRVIAVALVFFVLTVHVTHAFDYCDSKLCPVGKTHIACKNNGSFDSVNCGSNLEIVRPALIKYAALKHINEYKNDVAAANNPFTPPASRLPVTVWDNELAKIAELIVKRCRTAKEDLCISSSKYPNVTSLHYHVDPIEYPNTDFTKLFDDALNLWRITERYLIKEEILCPTKNSLEDSDYAVILTEKGSRVGCAALQSRVNPTSVSFILSCVFSAKTYPGEALYTIGAPGKDCKTGTSKCYPALCSDKEALC